MKRIPQPDIRKYCRDQRFVLKYNRPYSNTEYRFRITNIKSEYNDSNPITCSTWQDIIINIVIDGTVEHKNREGKVYDVKTLKDDLRYQLTWNPRSPRKHIRRNILSGIGHNGYSFGANVGPNLFSLFLKCLNLGEHNIKLGTIAFGTV
jgi:hypothetical protein